ncbi:MAG: nucleotide pyrophosphohydrolase [Candidatus Diapherotrites archaeon]|nr:nucleotide pyrophosphohydrolase [Candidatus Diapherotrites archaeon]
MQIQERIKNFEEKHKIKTTPEFRCLDLISEAGEVAKEILKMTKYGKEKNFLANESIEMEIGDLLFSLLCLANNFNIDLEKALDKSLKGYEKRIAEKGTPAHI